MSGLFARRYLFVNLDYIFIIIIFIIIITIIIIINNTFLLKLIIRNFSYL
jgi:hypothetical protein